MSSFNNNVPNEILGMIYAYCGEKTFYEVRRVCKKWACVKAHISKYKAIRYKLMRNQFWWLSRDTMRELDLNDIQFFWRDNDRIIDISEFKNLNCLKIDLGFLVNNSLHFLSSLSKLKRLHVNRWLISDDSMYSLREGIESIVFNNCTINGLNWVRRMVELRSMALYECDGSVDYLNVLSDGVPGLKELHINNFNYLIKGSNDDEIANVCNKMVGIESFSFTSWRVKNVKLDGMSGLRKLRLNCRILEGRLNSLVGLVNLRELDISWCVYISSEELGQLGLMNLRTLNVSSCTNVNDKILLQWQNMKELEVLEISKSVITDLGIIYLCELIKLRELVMTFCDEITDVGILYLCELPNLQFFDVSYCKKITNDGIESFKGRRPKIDVINGEI